MNGEKTRWVWLAGLLLAAYGPAWGAGYIWDDDAYVTMNPLLTARDGLWRIWFSLQSPSQYFPLTYTTFYFERGLWGLNPAGYHMVNILLHTVNAVLLWRLLGRLRVPGAWLAAAIFGLHPVQVESVAWITERKNVLMGLFFLLALINWARFIDEKTVRPRRYYILAAGFYLLSLSAKSTACTLPAAMLLILWLEKKPINWPRLKEVSLFVLLGMGMGLVTVWWERFHQGTEGKLFHLGLGDRWFLACRAVWFYLWKLVWPVNLAFSYPHWKISASDPRAYFWVGLTVAAGGIIWWARRWTGRSVEVAAVYFVATLSPLLGFIMLYTFAYSFVADHYQYMACIGPMALAASGIWLGLKSYLRLAVCVGLLATLGVLTWRQAETYADAETLWQATLERNPNSWLAHNNKGTILLAEGDLDDAMVHFKKALAIDPTLPGAAHNLGVIYAQKGEMDKAIAAYHEALAVEPNFAKARVNLACALMAKGDLDGAIAEIEKGLAIQPRVPGAHNTLGVIYVKKGLWDKAIAEFQEVLKTDPNDDGTRKNLELAVAQQAAAEAAGKTVKPKNP